MIRGTDCASGDGSAARSAGLGLDAVPGTCYSAPRPVSAFFAVDALLAIIVGRHAAEARSSNDSLRARPFSARSANAQAYNGPGRFMRILLSNDDGYFALAETLMLRLSASG